MYSKPDLLEHARNVLADPAESADHHVIALGDRQGRRVSRIASLCGGAGFAAAGRG